MRRPPLDNLDSYEDSMPNPKTSMPKATRRRAADYNPRTITDRQLADLKAAMETFGDLSGLVVNRRTGNTVGGHQRDKHFAGAEPVLEHEYEAPNAQGTVAVGFVEWAGERWAYREVDWDEDTEKAANIAANRHGGEWNLPALAPLLESLPDPLKNLTGFDVASIEAMLKEIAAPAAPKVPQERQAPDLTEQFILVIECGSEGELAELFGEMQGRGLACKLIT